MDIDNKPLRVLIQDYSWIHMTIGLVGNLSFFTGSILFFERFKEYKTLAIWLFVFGSLFMLIGSLGNFFVTLWEKRSRSSGQGGGGGG